MPEFVLEAFLGDWMNVWKGNMCRQIRYWKEKRPRRVARKEKVCAAASNGWRDGPRDMANENNEEID
jgi:hypothetical protein